MLRCSWNFFAETTRNVIYYLPFNRIMRKLFGKPPSCILEWGRMLIGGIYICNHKKKLDGDLPGNLYISVLITTD